MSTKTEKGTSLSTYAAYALGGLLFGAVIYFGYNYFAEKKTVAAIPGEKSEAAGRMASWNCQKNPNHPSCKEPRMASYFCQKNPTHPACAEPVRKVTMTTTS